MCCFLMAICIWIQAWRLPRPPDSDSRYATLWVPCGNEAPHAALLTAAALRADAASCWVQAPRLQQAWHLPRAGGPPWCRASSWAPLAMPLPHFWHAHWVLQCCSTCEHRSQ